MTVEVDDLPVAFAAQKVVEKEEKNQTKRIDCTTTAIFVEYYAGRDLAVLALCQK